MYPIAVIDETGQISDEIKQCPLWHRRKDFVFMGSTDDESNALDFIKRNNAVLVFIATNNRQVDDIHIISEIKRQLPDVHFVLVGEDYSYNTVREGFLANAFDYILHPIDSDILEQTISRLYDDFGVQYIRDNLAKRMDLLIDNIFEGNDCIPELCTNILDTIYTDWSSDLVNCHIIIKKAKETIYEDIIYRKPWIKKFIYDKNFIHLIGTDIKPEAQVKAEWSQHFSEVKNVIIKYQMLNHNLIYNIGKYVIVHVDEHLTLEKVASNVFLNKSYISHIFKKVSGISFVNFMTDVKIDRAKILLMNTNLKIYEVASTIGYNNPEYFSRVFKSITGVTPNEYRDGIAS